MADGIKQKLVDRLKEVGAYTVGVADPTVGFEYSEEGRHPLDLWNECRSVIVFAVACPPKTNNIYIGPYSPHNGRENPPWEPGNLFAEDYAMNRLVRTLLNAITLQGLAFLQTEGHRVMFWPHLRRLQLKLCAYEAGLGVYGRSGVILNPVLGNRLRLGVLLSDQVIEPDGRLENYTPCENCDRCVRRCPGKAYDATKDYPQSWSREKCIGARTRIAEKGQYCHNCYAVCPAGTIDDDKLLRIVEARSFLKRDRDRRTIFNTEEEKHEIIG